MNTLAQHNAVLNNAEEDTNLLCIAAVFGAAGVRGAVRLKVFTTDIKSISDFGPVTLFARGSKDARKIKVKFLHNVKGGVAVKLEGVDDRDQAEALKGAKLYIERDILPKIEEKEDFYFEDLVGLIVKDQLGQIFGEVDGVFNFGAGDIIEVKFNLEKVKRMYPFSNEIVPEVNIDEGYIVIDRYAFGDNLIDENTETHKEKG